MRPEDMMDAISRIHDDNIEEFAQVRPARFQVPWGMLATVAAFCIVIASAVWLRGAGILPGGTTTEPEPTFSHPCTTLPLPTEPATTLPASGEKEPPFRPDGKRIRDEEYDRLAALLESEDGILNNIAETGLFYTPPVSLNLLRHCYRPATQFSPEEVEFLTEAGLAQYLDGFIRRAPAQEVRQLYAEYFHISLDEMPESQDPLIKYWEQTDCYYLAEAPMGGDYRAYRAYRQDNGLIHLYYNEVQQADQLPRYLMILQPTDTGYRILANCYRSEIERANASVIQTLVPRMDPQLPAGEGVVYDRWTFEGGWSSEGTAYTFRLRVPALQPDSEGAVQINEEIRERINSDIETLQSSCMKGQKPGFASMDYDTWMIGHIRVVRLIEVSHYGNQQAYTYYLDTVTGERLENADFAGMSHLEWLYRSCAMLKTHLGEDHRDGCGLFVSTKPNENGQLFLSHNCLAANAPPPLKVAFDPNAGGSAEPADMYHWLFNVQTDAAFSTQWSIHLAKIFFENPAAFVRALVKEDAETVGNVADHVWFEMPYEDIPRYVELLTEIRALTSNTKEAETAQTMLDSAAGSTTLHLDDILRYHGAFSLVTDRESALEHRNVLYYLCMENPANFFSYMTLQDERYYAFYWQAVLSRLPEGKYAEVYDAAMQVITSPYYFSKKVWSALLLLSTPHN